MLFAKSTIAVALFTSYVAAQTANSTIDPDSITATMRAQWCSSEISTCGDLCGGSGNNTCDSTTLDYTCTCANGSSPGLQYYSGSLSSLICEEIYSDCINAGANNKAAQDLCTEARMKNCGTLDAASYTAAASSSSSSSVASSTAAATTTTTGTAGAASTTSTSKAAAATMMALGREYGSGVVAVGVAAAFGLMI